MCILFTNNVSVGVQNSSDENLCSSHLEFPSSTSMAEVVQQNPRDNFRTSYDNGPEINSDSINKSSYGGASEQTLLNIAASAFYASNLASNNSSVNSSNSFLNNGIDDIPVLDIMEQEPFPLNAVQPMSENYEKRVPDFNVTGISYNRTNTQTLNETGPVTTQSNNRSLSDDIPPLLTRERSFSSISLELDDDDFPSLNTEDKTQHISSSFRISDREIKNVLELLGNEKIHEIAADHIGIATQNKSVPEAVMYVVVLAGMLNTKMDKVLAAVQHISANFSLTDGQRKSIKGVFFSKLNDIKNPKLSNCHTKEILVTYNCQHNYI